HLTILLYLACLVVVGSLAAQEEESRLGIYDTLKLKNFHPESRLEVPAHTVLRARYPVIDAHSHAYLKGDDVHRWVQMMKACNVRKVLVLSGGFGEQLDSIVADYLGKYPDHFQVWARIDEKDIDAPDYPKRAAKSVEEAFRKGARGLGEYKDMGWGFGGDRKKKIKGVNIDDPRWDLALETAGRLGMPVSIHTGDMEDCYYPLTASSDLGIAGAPWNVYGKEGILPKAAILATRNHAMAKHPKTTFIGCHVGNLSHDLGQLGRLLDLYPNFYIDISARAWDIGRQPYSARRFFIRYQDRILFGTDLGPSEDMYRGWFRLLETEDEFFRVPDAAWWMNYGLNLPDEVLQKVYYLNATKLFLDMDSGAW
ncbi:MAG TPA: amidohydrolase family protein, partial [Candidatus Glassbacteria bacterium]|nr:amidohydrolase family protein [Candidatus Glassbacteria bacterium]